MIAWNRFVRPFRGADVAIMVTYHLGQAGLVLSLHDHSFCCSTKRLFRNGTACSGPSPLKCMRCAAGHYGVTKGLATLAAHSAMRPILRRRVDLFLPVTMTLDEKLYGGRPATDEDYRGCRAVATRLEVLLAS